MRETSIWFRIGYTFTARKVSKYGVFLWSVFSCIRTEYRKIQTRKDHHRTEQTTFHTVIRYHHHVTLNNPKNLGLLYTCLENVQNIASTRH